MIRFGGPARPRLTLDFDEKRRALLDRAETRSRAMIAAERGMKPEFVTWAEAAARVLWAKSHLQAEILMLQRGGWRILRDLRRASREQGREISKIEPVFVGAVIYRDFAGRYSLEIAFVGEPK